MLQATSYSDIVYRIIGAAMEVHKKLNWGLLEPVYQEALHLELLDRGIPNEREKTIDIYYKHHHLEKKYKMDIVVDDVIIELKSVTRINAKHRAQLCNYLRLTRKPVGLLINYGEEQLIGERWALDKETNRCFLVDRDMKPVEDVDYHELFYADSLEEEMSTEEI
jgi:GxxExxY protein